MEINLNNNINMTKDKAEDTVNIFLNDLKESLEKNNKEQYHFVNQSERYEDYWKYQDGLEENVCARLGISRYDRNNKYFNKLGKAVNKSILEIAKEEGTALYIACGPQGSLEKNAKGKYVTKTVYDIDKYEDGKSEDLDSMEIKEFPKTMEENGNFRYIVFQVDDENNIKIRDDLKEKIINLASEKCAKLREETVEQAKDFKKEGHLYEAHKYDGSVFLDDITEENYSFEDIDFVVDQFDGEGTYKVIDGVYTKVSDDFYSEE